MTVIPLAPPSLAGSSNRPGSIGRAVLLPYLVLLRAGFCLPRVLPPARCALTAPFHHCHPPSPLSRLRRDSAVCFLCHFPSSCPDRALPGALPCGVRTFLGVARKRPRDRLACCDPRHCTSHRSPVRSGTAPASCTNCCEACRWLRPSSRYSSRSRAVCRRGMRVRRCP
jgi:hypothetical protein